MPLRDLTDGQECDLYLVLRAREERCDRDGGRSLKLTLGDRTGTVAGFMTEPLERAPDSCRAGSVVHVCGTYGRDPRLGGQLTVTSLRLAQPGEVDVEDLLDG